MSPGKYKNARTPLPPSLRDKPVPTRHYTSELHDKDVEKMLGEGMMREDFCKKYQICKKTFETWREVHPSFDEAVNRGAAAGEAVWLKMGKDHCEADFNFPYWSSIMNAQYNFGAKKIKGTIKGMNPSEIIKFATELYTAGEINRNQHDRFMVAADRLLKAEEIPTLRAEVELLKEELAKQRAAQQG